jgi:hypothetical protein
VCFSQALSAHEPVMASTSATCTWASWPRSTLNAATAHWGEARACVLGIGPQHHSMLHDVWRYRREALCPAYIHRGTACHCTRAGSGWPRGQALSRASQAHVMRVPAAACARRRASQRRTCEPPPPPLASPVPPPAPTAPPPPPRPPLPSTSASYRHVASSAASSVVNAGIGGAGAPAHDCHTPSGSSGA